ncbi:MAG: hypothetical protein QM658_04765 [Gordonia sp. (in: high G+C Gram-positive bacteria)]
MSTRASHGTLAAVVSAALGIGAHALADGRTVPTSHLLVLVAVAWGAGALRSAQVARDDRRRARGRTSSEWLPVLGLLAAGQAASHLALTLLGHAGHHEAGVGSSTTMLAWHAAAIPAAAAVLAVGRLAERLFSTAAQIMLDAGPVTPRRESSIQEPPVEERRRGVDHWSTITVRGPPLAI